MIPLEEITRLSAEALGYTVFPDNTSIITQSMSSIRQSQCPNVTSDKNEASRLLLLLSTEDERRRFSVCIRAIVSKFTPVAYDQSAIYAACTATAEQITRAALVGLGKITLEEALSATQ